MQNASTAIYITASSKIIQYFKKRSRRDCHKNAKKCHQQTMYFQLQ